MPNTTSPWTGTAAGTNTGAPTVTTLGTAAAIAVINDPDTLTTGEKPAIIQDYNVLTGENADLVAKANAYGVTHAAYDAAYTALVTTYLPTLTSPTAWNALTGTTALGVGNRVALWNPKWQALRNAVSDLRNAISVGTAQAAITTAATDATNKANVAQLASQPHQVAWAYTAKPALPSALYPAGYYAITTDSRTVQVNPGGTAWTDVLVAATGLFGQIFAHQLVVSNSDNLISNPNALITNPPAGSAEGNNLINWGFTTTPMSSNGWIRSLVGNPTGISYGLMTPGAPGAGGIEVSPGEKYYLECYAAKNGVSAGNPHIEIVLDTPSSPWCWAAPSNIVTSLNAYAPDKLTLTVTIPDTIGSYGTPSKMHVLIRSDNGSVSTLFNRFYLRRMNDASVIVDGTLQALVAKIPLLYSLDMRSGSDASGFTPGTSVAAPIGFRISANTFTTMYIGGATAADCQIEMGGSANFGGYRVATVNDRVQPVNRIVNGYFYTDLNGWSASGANPPTYNASSVTAGTGSATLTYVGGFGYTKGGNLTQSFSLPKTFPGQTINLAYQTGYSGNGTNAGSDVCTIQVYILNQTTGTETLLATHSYSNANVAVAWTARSVNITSYVSAGGQFSIRFAMTLNDSHAAGGFTNSLFVDEVSIIA